MQPTIIGVDLAKSVFQVHGVDAHGKVIVTRRLRRDAVLSFFANLPACLVGMEAGATAHHWAREISLRSPAYYCRAGLKRSVTRRMKGIG